MLPVMPVPVQGVIHGFCFHHADTAATERVIKHAIDLLPRTRLLFVSDIVQHRSSAIFSVEWSTDERPEGAWNGRTIDLRADGRDPNDTVLVRITHFAQQR